MSLANSEKWQQVLRRVTIVIFVVGVLAIYGAWKQVERAAAPKPSAHTGQPAAPAAVGPSVEFALALPKGRSPDLTVQLGAETLTLDGKEVGLTGLRALVTRRQELAETKKPPLVLVQCAKDVTHARLMAVGEAVTSAGGRLVVGSADGAAPGTSEPVSAALQVENAGALEPTGPEE